MIKQIKSWWKINKEKRKMDKVIICIENGWATIFPGEKEIDGENEEYNELQYYEPGIYNAYYNKELNRYVWLEKI